MISEQTLALPSNVTVISPFRYTGGLLSAAWRPTGEVFYLSFGASYGKTALFRSSANSVTDNVIAGQICIPRSYLSIA